MADEKVEQKDVKVVGSEASAGSNQGSGTTPPPGENSGSSEAENRIPQSRFNDVVKERNQERVLREQYESRIREFEQKERLHEQRVAGENEVTRLVSKYKIPEEAARDAVASADAISERKNQELHAQVRQAQLADWHRNMETKYKDYREMSPDMEKVYSSLDQTTQRMVTASPQGLEMLYSYAKTGKGDDAAKKAFEEGAAHSSSVRDEKKALSSTPGSGSKSPNSELSGEAIRKMSIEEFKKRSVEINDWLAGKPQ